MYDEPNYIDDANEQSPLELIADLEDEIKALRERNRELTDALKPFATAADCSFIKTKGRLAVNGKEFILAVGPDSALFLHTNHLDAAKAALTGKPASK